MTKDVVCVHKGDNLTEAAHTMIGAKVSCVVVLEGDKPVGILTERDFIKKLSMEKAHPGDMLVNDIMTKKLFTVDTHLDLFEAQKIMKTHNFRKLVIVENDELKGILTQTDLCRVAAELKSPYPPAPLVKEVMTRNVLTVAEDDKFLKAKKIMASKDIGSVLVTNKEQIKGVFTEFDIVSEFFLNPNKLMNSYMEDLMSSPVICISPGFDLFQINKIMLEHNFRRLSVVAGNKTQGIITQTDVARKLYSFIEKNKDFVEAKKAKQEKEAKYNVKRAGSIILYDKVREQEKVPEEETPKKK
ncbi:CBS domain-containing protein [Candidatus Woesearchaeota archaeon]|nr:CBS domain-containing protein [Candidatus Woesearchaeota archaeon]